MSGRQASMIVRKSADPVARARRWVLMSALAVLIGKLVVAATTFGTNDIVHWGDFLAGIRQAGPVGIYGLTFPANNSFYNHPPLIGYLLVAVNLVQDAGLPYRFTIRAISSVADVGTALVIFELLRTRLPLYRARIAGVAVAISPILFLVSGFHGNTDPIFVFLVFLGVLLLLDRRAPAAAGAVIALAIGIKIVPMIVIPALAVYALRCDRRTSARWLAGFAVAFALTWGPALVMQFTRVRQDVIGYSGFGSSPWGIEQIGHWLGDPSWVAAFAGSGRVLVVLICAIVPAVAVWRRPEVVVMAVAWSLIGFLALAPSWGAQYMVWPMAACYLIGVGLGHAYNITGGVVLFLVYDRWSGGLPWYRARATFVVPTHELIAMMVPWSVLVVVLIRATIKLFLPGSGEFNGEHVPASPVGKMRMPAETTVPPRNSGGGGTALGGGGQQSENREESNGPEAQ